MTPPAQRTETMDMHAADVATFRAEIAHLQKDMVAHELLDSQRHAQYMQTHTAIFEQLQTIQRMIWIGLGGVMVIGSLIAMIGGNILKLLR